MPLDFGPHWVKNYNLCCKIKVKIWSSLHWSRLLIKVLVVSQSNHKVNKSNFSNYFVFWAQQSPPHSGALQAYNFVLICLRYLGSNMWAFLRDSQEKLAYPTVRVLSESWSINFWARSGPCGPRKAVGFDFVTKCTGVTILFSDRGTAAYPE